MKQSNPDETGCIFCDQRAIGDGVCLERSPRVLNGITFNCTLPNGHEGHHVACGVWEHALHMWENDDEQ